MRSGRLNYFYRLSAARLVILRLRLARRWKRLFHDTDSFSRTSTGRGLIGMGLLLGLSGAAWLGYHAGQQTDVAALERTEVAPAAADAYTTSDFAADPATSTSQVAGQAFEDIKPVEQATVLGSEAISLPVMPAAPEAERIAEQSETIGEDEIVDLRETVGELRAKVQALEQETTGLEFELLDQEVAFAKAEERWSEESVERRVIYNITNVPIGGAISEELMGKDLEWPDIAASDTGNDVQWIEFPATDDDYNDPNYGMDGNSDVYEQYRDADSPMEAWQGDVYLGDMLDQQNMNSAREEYDDEYEWVDEEYFDPEPGSYSDLPIEQQIHQEIIYGPARDQYDDWDSQ